MSANPEASSNEACRTVIKNAKLDNDESVSNSSSVSATPPKKQKPGRRQQKYRKAWEFHPEFKLWLESVENDVYKAKCKTCGKVMVAELGVIQSHSGAKKHLRTVEQYCTALETINKQKDSGRSTIPLPRGLFKKSKDSTGNSESKDVSEDIPLDSLVIADQDEAYYASEGNFTDQSLSGEMSHVHHTPPLTRKPPEPAYFSKAVVTKPAPPWKATAIVNGHVTRLELNDYKGRYLILFFYPQNFSAVCPTEILALSDRVLEFRAIQTEIVACSVDSHLSHLAWARTPRNEGGLGNPKIPLLSDPTHAIARDYGVLLPDQGHSLRAHFIIDRRGILRHMLVNDPGVGRSIGELLRTTQALQQVDETETGCPADWKPGLPGV